jgi:hypothetical protein
LLTFGDCDGTEVADGPDEPGVEVVVDGLALLPPPPQAASTASRATVAEVARTGLKRRSRFVVTDPPSPLDDEGTVRADGECQ